MTIPLELEPDEARRRQELLQEGLGCQRPGPSSVKSRFVIRDQPPPATPAEGARRALQEFRKATRGSPAMKESLNGTADPPDEAPARKSRFKGVYPNNCKSRPWYARCSTGGKQVALGAFATEEDAGRAYDEALVSSGRPAVNFPAAGGTAAPELPPASTRFRPATTRAAKTELLPPGPEASLARELAAAGAIAAALAGLERSAAMRVLAFVGGHYQS